MKDRGSDGKITSDALCGRVFGKSKACESLGGCLTNASGTTES